MTPNYQETTQVLTFVYHTVVIYDVTGRGHSNSFLCLLCVSTVTVYRIGLAGKFKSGLHKSDHRWRWCEHIEFSIFSLNRGCKNIIIPF